MTSHRLPLALLLVLGCSEPSSKTSDPPDECSSAAQCPPNSGILDEASCELEPTCFVVEDPCTPAYCLPVDPNTCGNNGTNPCPSGSMNSDCEPGTGTCFRSEGACTSEVCEWPREVDPAGFGTELTCAEDADCVLVATGDVCGCLDCGTEALHGEAMAAYDEAVGTARMRCATTEGCPPELTCEPLIARCNLDTGACEAIVAPE